MFDQIFQVYSHLLANDGVSHIICDFATVFDEHKINNSLFTISLDDHSSFDKKKREDVKFLQGKITPKTLIIFHFAMPTPLSVLVSQLNCHKVLLYHNITPPVFFKDYNQSMQRILSAGYREVIYMAEYFSYAWGVSEYNCSQLKEAGYVRTSVAYPPYDFGRLDKIQPCNKIIKKNGVKSIIFVGRIAPNKRPEDIIKAFYYYHRINPNCELTLVGSYEIFENYKLDLNKLSETLNVPVNITGMVTNEELVAYYKNADIFLCMSEHEGFCLPLIEAMYFNIPVIAFDSSAVTETVGDAGIIFKQKHFLSVAHLMNEVLENITLQNEMKAAGRKRAIFFSKENTSKKIINLIENYALELNL